VTLAFISVSSAILAEGDVLPNQLSGFMLESETEAQPANTLTARIANNLTT